MTNQEARQAGESVDAHGRPSNERDGACICDYNPTTTDGPDECCPFHGRPYVYWIERGDALAERLAAVSALADEWAEDGPSLVRNAHSGGDVHEGQTLERCAKATREALATPPAPEAGETHA